MIRSDANRLSMHRGETAVFDVFGFNSYFGGPDSRLEKLWANGWDTTSGAAASDSGIRGSRDAVDVEGSGNLTVHVWAFDPYGPDGVFDSNGRDGVFGTDDDYTSSDPLDGGLSDFRAYAQTSVTTNIQAPWGGAVEVSVTLEEQPSLLGVVSWLDMYGDMRTLAWAQVIERSADGIWASSATGSYRLWLSEGPHRFLATTIGEEQLWKPFEFEIILSRPGVQTFADVTLVISGTETPEFASPELATLVSLIALAISISKRSKKSK
jgi:hypothetical protein